MVVSRRTRSPGRGGGRSGGSGYDYQDLYVGLHLAELLVGSTRDPLLEVLWEKKAVDAGEAGGSVEVVHVDDLILFNQSGAWTYVQVKENSPRSGWSIKQAIRSGIVDQFWRQWNVRPVENRQRTTLRLAAFGDVSPLRDVVDVALRSRTTGELLSAEGSATATGGVTSIAGALRISADSPDLLAFLQAFDAVQLPDAGVLDAWITRTLVAFGEHAPQVADRLIRLVGESKHSGHGARSSYTREALIDQLLADGLPNEQLIGAGLLRAAPLTSAISWSSHRAAVVRQYGTFRLYGLDAPEPVYAELATLFVPPRIAPTFRGSTEMYSRMEMERHLRGRHGRRHREAEEEEFPGDKHRGSSMKLDAMLSETRRFGFVAGPGTGKTTTLRWLALICAMEDENGSRRRQDIGLPAAPLIPVYVSFRQFARRVRARELEGVPGRVGLVADFLAAQLESGVIGSPPSRERALQIAQWLLESEQTFLLFDGLDEVPDAGMREMLFAAVVDLIQTYEAPRVVIATRPSGIRALRLCTRLPFFEPLPLDETRRAAFARRWYEAVRTDGGTLLDPQDADRRGIDLAIAAEALSDLTSNPLLLSILALIHFNRGGVPIDRATLYDHATSAMLGHWDRDAAGRDLGEDAIPRNWSEVLDLTSDQIREVMEVVGWDLHETRQVELPVAAMTDIVTEAITKVAPRCSHAPKDRAAVMIQLLCDRSGLLLEREPGILGFAHLSFRDYLAARYRVRMDACDLRPFVALAADDAHDEVLRFAFGILRLIRPDGGERTQELITKIAATAPSIAASGLLDAPEIHLAPTTIERLAHGVWMEAERGLSDRRTTIRLLGLLLSRFPEPDRLLLSLLARAVPHDHRMPSELPARALLSRPAGPLDPDLAWLLGRIVAAPPANGRERERGSHDRETQTQLSAVASLLLVECNAADPTENVDALAGLLGDRFSANGSASVNGTPEERATRILRAALKVDAARKVVQARLRTLAKTKTSKIDRLAIIHLLVDASVAATTGTVAVLMDALHNSWEREDAAKYITLWLVDPASTATVTRALERGLISGNEIVRRTSGRLLGRVELPIASSPDRTSDGGGEQERIARIVTMLNDPATGGQTHTVLEEELWDDHDLVAWQAARALAAAGRYETLGLTQTLVRVGFGSETRQAVATDVLRAMLNDPRSRRATRAALLEGTKNSNDRIAAVSALFLLETGGIIGDPYIARNIKAALRDTSTFRSALPHIEKLLGGEVKDAALEVLLEYVRADKPNTAVAGQLSLVLAEHKSHEPDILIRALALFGCAHEAFRQKAMTLLRGMLDDREFTTQARRVLGKTLDAEDRDVAWCAARLLCERGSFTERSLADVLSSVGLNRRDSFERAEARRWIEELFTRPRQARLMREALERSIGLALHRGEHNKNFKLAWEAASCLVAANAFEAEDLAEALLAGGFGDRDRHNEAMTFLDKLSTTRAELAGDIETKLWDAVEDDDEDVRWGAACALLDLFGPSVVEMGAKATRPVKNAVRKEEDDHEEATKALKVFASLVCVFLGEVTAAAAARDRIHRMLESDLETATRKALAYVLEQRATGEEPRMAFLAAECLMRIGDHATKHIASALIEGGLQDNGFRERASAALDGLRGDPMTAPVVMDALGSALWSSDDDVGAVAAEYLVERGEVRSAGVIRGLVRARRRHHRRGWNPSQHVEALLRDRETHDATICALGAAVFEDDAEIHYDAAKLLLMSGAPVTKRLLDVLDHVAQNGSTTGPLAALAFTRRVEEIQLQAGEARSALVSLVGGPVGRQA